MSGITPAVLARLQEFDTPTICNIIELFEVRPRNQGFMDRSIRAAFPEMKPMVGFASTISCRTSYDPRMGSAAYAGLDDQIRAFGDLDGDGRVDAVVNVNDGEALILRNQSDAGHSITVRLEGAGLNRDAIGASVRVRTEDGREQHGFRASAGSYLSSNADDLHFGLGDSGRAERVQVWWPNGSTQAVSGQTSGLVVIRQPAAGSKASR